MQIDTSPRPASPKPPPAPPWWSGLERMILRAALYLAMALSLAVLAGGLARFSPTEVDRIVTEVERLQLSTVLIVSLGALAISARRRE